MAFKAGKVLNGSVVGNVINFVESETYYTDQISAAHIYNLAQRNAKNLNQREALANSSGKITNRQIATALCV